MLVADKASNRLLEVDPYGRVVWRFPMPGDLAPGQTFQVPDDAFYSPNGRSIVATQEDDFTISAIDVHRHRISYRYGVPGVPGSSANHVYNPNDAMMLPGGQILTADIKNCRLLVVQPPSHSPVRQIGSTAGCIHDPPRDFGSPNGAFPASNGDILANDDYNDRVIVVDPRTNKIVWQYGHAGRPGTKPGFLNIPDGADLAPPNSLIDGFPGAKAPR